MVITVAKAHKDTRGQNGKSYSGIGGRPPIIHRIAAMSVRMVMINRSVFHAIKSWWKT